MNSPNRYQALLGIIIICSQIAFMRVLLGSNPPTSECVRAMSKIDSGIAELVNEQVTQLLERRRLYQTYAAPGRLLGSIGFQAAMRHLYIRLNSGADIPSGAKNIANSFGSDLKQQLAKMKAAKLVDGRMFYKVIEKDPKHAANSIIETLGTLFYAEDLFPDGPKGPKNDDHVESAKELKRRAQEIGFSTSDYSNASKEITALLRDPRKTAELTNFLIEILPEYGPIVVRQALANEPTPVSGNLFSRSLRAITSVTTNMGANREVNNYHKRWETELSTGIDEISKSFGLSPNQVEALVATHEELKVNQVAVIPQITIPNFDILTADERQVSSLSSELELASKEFFRMMVAKGPRIADPTGWTEFNSQASDLLKKFPKASKFPRVTAVSELSAPLENRQRAIKQQLFELSKVMEHLNQIELPARGTYEVSLEMQEQLLETLAAEGQDTASPKVVTLMNQSDVLRSMVERLQSTRSQLEGLEILLSSQDAAIKSLVDGLLYSENILDTNLSSSVFNELENLQTWASKSLSDKNSGKALQPIKLIGTSKASIGGE